MHMIHWIKIMTIIVNKKIIVWKKVKVTNNKMKKIILLANSLLKTMKVKIKLSKEIL